MDSGYIQSSKYSSQESRGWCQVLSHIIPVCVIILLTMLVPWVFSHTVWLDPALWIGAGLRSVKEFTSNRFPCPNDTLHDVDEWFSFAVSIQRSVSGDNADDADAAWSYVFKGEFVILGIIDLSYVHRRFSFLKHDNLMVHQWRHSE